MIQVTPITVTLTAEKKKIIQVTLITATLTAEKKK